MDRKNYQIDLQELTKQNNIQDFEQGLSTKEANKRLEEFGPNKLES